MSAQILPPIDAAIAEVGASLVITLRFASEEAARGFKNEALIDWQTATLRAPLGSAVIFTRSIGDEG